MNKGKEYENKAEQFLLKNNFIILKRNARFKKIEIDFICKKEENLYVFEVKFRKFINLFQSSPAQLKRIETYMLIHFPGQFFEFKYLLFSPNSLQIISL